MKKNLIETVKELAELEPKATAKPWYYGSHPDHCQIGCDDCVEPSDPNCPNPIKEDWQPIAMVGWGDVVPGVYAKPYNYNQANRNGELIEGLRNAAPSMLAVLSQFKKLDALKIFAVLDQMKGYDEESLMMRDTLRRMQKACELMEAATDGSH